MVWVQEKGPGEVLRRCANLCPPHLLQVLKNDVLAHQATVETVNKAGNELLESSAGDDASSLRNRLENLNSCWESVLQKTEEREQQLQSTLQQVREAALCHGALLRVLCLLL